MEVCGGQTHTIVKYGIDEILPPSVELVHGPGCPVCVTSLEMIDRAHAIASRPDVIFCSFGDMLRVPGSRGDLLQLKVAGQRRPRSSIRRSTPSTWPRPIPTGRWSSSPSASRRRRRANAMAVWLAASGRLTNFSVLVSHVLVPPAMTAILEAPGQPRAGLPRARATSAP